MQSPTTLAGNLENASADFLARLRKFTPIEFNTVPFENSWTPGQVAQHIYKAVKGMPQVLNGQTQPTTRAADAHCQNLASVFLDLTTRLQSPDFILPEKADYDRDQMINNLSSTFASIAENARQLDLSSVCLDFEMPQSGFLTRHELIYFTTIHTQRHSAQLDRIHSAMAK